MTNELHHVAELLTSPMPCSALLDNLISMQFYLRSQAYFTCALPSPRGKHKIEQLHQGKSCHAFSLKIITKLLTHHGIRPLCNMSHYRLLPSPPLFLPTCTSMILTKTILGHIPEKTPAPNLLATVLCGTKRKRGIRQWTGKCQACACSKIQRHNIALLDNVTPTLSGRFFTLHADIAGTIGNSNFPL